MKTITSLLITLLLFSCQQDEYVDCSSIEGNTISGPITRDLSKCPLDYSKPIELNTGGGNLAEAIRIADRIGLNESTVIVGDNCLSACFLFIAAAAEKIHCFDSLVAVHQATTEEGTRVMINYLNSQPIRNMNLLADIIWRTPNNRMTLLQKGTLTRMGLIDKVIDCD